jgi:hypothetical protein
MKYTVRNKEDADCFNSTAEHIEEVKHYMQKIIVLLQKRAGEHDKSKLEPPEFETFSKYTPVLSNLEYGSSDYKECIASMQDALQHHYAYNEHHPEHIQYKDPEIWKDIKNYEGIYQVSNYGNIKRVPRTILRNNGRSIPYKEYLLKPNITPKGYLRIQLVKNTKQSNLFIHRLVAETFVPNPENKPEVNHINGNKKDAFYKNLEWTTSSENQQHAYDIGLKKAKSKYIIFCKELNIITFGIDSMIKKLKQLGYNQANSGAIYNCISGAVNMHLNLHFISYNIEEYSPLSNLRFFNLVDVLEMFVDWYCASKRQRNGNIQESMKVNKERFKIADDLYQIFLNTIELLDVQ